jgi:hypothetical protein
MCVPTRSDRDAAIATPPYCAVLSLRTAARIALLMALTRALITIELR